jgi:CheY-like chemotaxis protein
MTRMTMTADRRPTVLVVDDDPDVLAITSDLLVEDGNRVVAASDGTTALQLLDGDRSVCLLVTDVVMPGMSGFELAARARQRRPDLPILYVSGYYKEGSLAPQALSYGKLIEKPWRPDALKREVRAAMTGDQSDRS